MTASLQILPGEGPIWDTVSVRIIRELGRVVDPTKAEECYSNVLYLIRQKIQKKILPEDVQPWDVVAGAINGLGRTLGEAGWVNDLNFGVRMIVDRAAQRKDSEWPLKMANEITATYLGDPPDGTTSGAMKLSKRQSCAGGA